MKTKNYCPRHPQGFFGVVPIRFFSQSHSKQLGHEFRGAVVIRVLQSLLSNVRWHFMWGDKKKSRPMIHSETKCITGQRPGQDRAAPVCVIGGSCRHQRVPFATRRENARTLKRGSNSQSELLLRFMSNRNSEAMNMYKKKRASQ